MDLNKALLVMQHAPEWRNTVEAACLFRRKPYGVDILAAMTELFLDDIYFDDQSQSVIVPETIGKDVLDAVEEYSPTLIPESTFIQRLEALESEIDSLGEMQTKLDLIDDRVQQISESVETTPSIDVPKPGVFEEM